VCLVAEGFSLKAGRPAGGRRHQQRPLLAVPLFILVGIVATRTEIATRL
jgi:hypothetical protein